MSLARRLRRANDRVPRGMIRCPHHGVVRAFLACTHLHDEGLYKREEVKKSRRRVPLALCRKCWEIDVDPEELVEACGVCIDVLYGMLGDKPEKKGARP